MRFIGITGGIGAGKSEILAFIKRHYKCQIYLADEVAHLVKKPGTKCFSQLIQLLGKEILTSDGTIDKGKMAEKIFSDQALLEQVNQLIHPAVQEFVLQKLEEAKKEREIELFFLEAALLIESGYGKLVDEMWYIYADKEVRIKRLKSARGYSGEKIERIMEKQLADETFREQCDFVIDNSGSLADSLKQIEEKLEAYTWLE